VAKIETTTKKFKEGVRLSGDSAEIRWESTGYLSVRLLDAGGSVPLAARPISVDIPGEGKVSLETDGDGKAFHPDVPFQDYELDLGEQVKVTVPAVANADEVHERHVPGVVFAFLQLHVRDADGFGLSGGKVSLSGPASAEVRVDAEGMVRNAVPLPGGEYDVTWTKGDVTFTGKVTLGDRLRGLLVATLTKPGA
jgi:hypothetical protein